MAAHGTPPPLIPHFMSRAGTADDTGVKHTIRHTMLALGVGVVVQRLCQLAAFVLAGRALGVAGLGVLAQGQAVAAMLTVMTAAGVGNIAARALAAAPDNARAVIVASVRRRLLVGAVLALGVGLFATAGSVRPLFWWLCALQVLPAAFDQKALLDAAGRTRHEVGLETVVAMLQLFAVLIASSVGISTVEVFAALPLAGRCLYAMGAVRTIVRLPAAPAAPTPVLANVRLAIGQLAHELLTIGDIWLVAVLLGDATAGFYALGVRFAAAALIPSAQLTRLLLPHLLHAHADGGAARTLGTALRATLLVTLPMFAGGTAAADSLCRLCGAAFVEAAPVLRLVLLAGCLQHLGWQCSNALLSAWRDRAYAHGFGWPSVAHLLLLLAATQVAAPSAAAFAVLAGGIAASAQLTYAATGLALTRVSWRGRVRAWWQAPLVAAATAAATAAPGWLVEGLLRLPLQLAAGAGAFGLGLWFAELRGRWRRVGDGLAAASGFSA